MLCARSFLYLLVVESVCAGMNESNDFYKYSFSFKGNGQQKNTIHKCDLNKNPRLAGYGDNLR
jgi:hypothetical protein